MLQLFKALLLGFIVTFPAFGAMRFDYYMDLVL